MRLISQNDPHTLNPILATTATENEFGSLSFDRLVDADSRNQFQPMLATVVPTVANGGIARDGLTYTFHLRRDVRWQDGRPFSSADVAFTMHAILDSRVNVSDRNGYDDISRVETPDATTAVFRLKRRFAPFLAQVCEQYPILPAHLLAKSANLNSDAFNGHPIGTGPYRLVRWDRGNRVSYVANAHYFLGSPAIPKIDVVIMPDVATQGIALRRHDVDFSTVESSQYGQLRDVASLRTALEPQNDFVAAALNTSRPILADVRVRRALAMAIDRVRIAHDNTYGTGKVAYADLPAFLWTTREPLTPTPFNPARANRLLNAAGWRLGSDGIRVRSGTRLHLDGIDYGGSSTGRNVDAQIQQMLHAVGVDLSWKYYDPALYYAAASAGGPVNTGRYDLADYTFVAGVDPENDELYTCANRAPAGFNAARYCDSRMDALQAASLAELDPAARLRIVARIEALAASDVPYVFLYHTPKRLVWTPSLRRTPSSLNDWWHDVRKWSFAST